MRQTLLRTHLLLPLLLVLVGISAIALAIAADAVGIGNKTGFGPGQIILTLAGSVLLLAGLLVASPTGQLYLRDWRTESKTVEQRRQPSTIFLTAVWFGLVTGLLEGSGLLALQRLGWMSWRMSNEFTVSTEIIWLSPVVDLMLFTIVGLFLAGVARLLPGLPIAKYSTLLFAFLALFALLAVALSHYLEAYALICLAAGFAVVLTRWVRKHNSGFLSITRKSLPWVAVGALVSLVGIQGGQWLEERLAIGNLPEAASGSPNIVLIVVDTLRADHLSAYGYERATSPNLDRIAEQGVLFENAFSTSSWTPPSHASLVTGRYQYEHQVDWDRVLGSRYATIGEALSRLGYRTGGFSANERFFSKRFGFGRGFTRFEDYSVREVVTHTLYLRELQSLKLFRGLSNRRKLAEDVNESLLSWIDRDVGKPFFAMLNYFDVHDPYRPPEPFRSRFRNQVSDGSISGLLDLDRINGYDGAISYVDHKIGELLSELRERQLADNTIVIVTSDHGESFGEHGLFTHGHSLYHETIHVPLIISWPGQVPAQLRIARPVTNASVPATLMDLIGGDDQGLFPCPSLTQLWKDPESNLDWPDPLAEIERNPHARDTPVSSGAIRSLINSKWHYIEHENLGIELYDWSADPMELHNLAETVEMQGILAQFRRRFSFFNATNQ